MKGNNMSDSSTTELLERASEMITYFEGKLPVKVIEADLERNDLDMLWVHVHEAEMEISRQAYYGADYAY